MDYLSLKAAAAEIKGRFFRRKVQETRQVSPREVFFLFEKRESIALSIDPLRPGLFILDAEPGAEGISSPFGDLVNSRIKGSVLTSVSIQEPGERVVTLTFEPGWPAKSGEPIFLVLEVMGRHSNLAALQTGRVLQPMKAVPPEKSPGRPMLPGVIWKPPPPRPGIPPEDVGTEGLPDPSRPDIASSLLAAIRGLSPHTIRQLLRMTSAGSREELREAIGCLLASADGKNGWLHSVGDRTHLCPFEPMIAPGSAETIQPFTPFSAASAAWRNTLPGDIDAVRDKTGRLAAVLGRIEEQLTTTLARLDREMERCSSHEEYRLMAETLLIHASGLRPGEVSVSLPDPYEPGRTLTIPLDPSLSAVENADRFFTDARRLKRGIAEIPGRREQAERDLSSLADAREALLERGDPVPARTLLGKRYSGHSKGKGTPFRAYGGPGRKHVFEGFTILVGRSASDNEKVTFQAAGPHDLWLHARDYSGSHVVILTEGRTVPEKILHHAAALAAENSGAKNDTAPEIMVTERKWVKKLKGGKPGKVTVERHRTVRPRRGKQG